MKILASWVVLFLAVMLAALCLPARADDEETVDINLPPHIQRQCAAAGGCVLMPRASLAAEIKRAKQDALMVGYLAGAADAADKGCRRDL